MVRGNRVKVSNIMVLNTDTKKSQVIHLSTLQDKRFFGGQAFFKLMRIFCF